MDGETNFNRKQWKKRGKGARMYKPKTTNPRIKNPIKNVYQLKSIDGVKYQSTQPLQNVGQLGLFKATG